MRCIFGLALIFVIRVNMVGFVLFVTWGGALWVRFRLFTVRVGRIVWVRIVVFLCRLCYQTFSALL